MVVGALLLQRPDVRRVHEHVQVGVLGILPVDLLGLHAVVGVLRAPVRLAALLLQLRLVLLHFDVLDYQ